MHNRTNESSKIELFIHDEFGTKDSCAECLGVSRHTLYRWVKSPGKMPVSALIALVKKTKQPVNKIIDI